MPDRSLIPFFDLSKLMYLGTIPSTTAIGTIIDTNDTISISDPERRKGLYILGKPGMGKSSLMVNIAIADIKHGHGLVFVDPHGTAITDLIRHSSDINEEQLLDRCLFFDPEYESSSFGINLLACDNIHSLQERNDTFNRAKAVFDKVWKNTYH